MEISLVQREIIDVLMPVVSTPREVCILEIEIHGDCSVGSTERSTGILQVLWSFVSVSIIVCYVEPYVSASPCVNQLRTSLSVTIAKFGGWQRVFGATCILM